MSIIDHENRKTDYDIGELFLERWSPRAMTGEEMPDADLMAIFEAARFAPSSNNEQPWRFVYARSGTDRFAKFESILNASNWRWAKNSSVLLIVAAKETFTQYDRPNATAQFDAGCAWGYLALEATRRGYVTHGMAGFDRDKAREILGIPDGYHPIAAIAGGRLAPKETLPEDLQAREAPAPRRTIAEFAFEGGFGG